MRGIALFTLHLATVRKRCNPKWVLTLPWSVSDPISPAVRPQHKTSPTSSTDPTHIPSCPHCPCHSLHGYCFCQTHTQYTLLPRSLHSCVPFILHFNQYHPLEEASWLPECWELQMVLLCGLLPAELEPGSRPASTPAFPSQDTACTHLLLNKCS